MPVRGDKDDPIKSISSSDKENVLENVLCDQWGVRVYHIMDSVTVTWPSLYIVPQTFWELLVKRLIAF